jgi:hypothetical protein
LFNQIIPAPATPAKTCFKKYGGAVFEAWWVFHQIQISWSCNKLATTTFFHFLCRCNCRSLAPISRSFAIRPRVIGSDDLIINVTSHEFRARRLLSGLENGGSLAWPHTQGRASCAAVTAVWARSASGPRRSGSGSDPPRRICCHSFGEAANTPCCGCRRAGVHSNTPWCTRFLSCRHEISLRLTATVACKNHPVKVRLEEPPKNLTLQITICCNGDLYFPPLSPFPPRLLPIPLPRRLVAAAGGHRRPAPLPHRSLTARGGQEDTAAAHPIPSPAGGPAADTARAEKLCYGRRRPRRRLAAICRAVSPAGARV